MCEYKCWLFYSGGVSSLQMKKNESIMKGLHYPKERNENWHPEFFMTDFETSEISAIEETFPGIKQIL